MQKDKATNEEKQAEQKAYNEYVKQVTPTHSLPKNMAKAFLLGGVICIIGQGILNYAISLGLDKDTAGSWCSLALVLTSVVLTGCNIYPKLANFGFANSVAAPCVEFKKEGQVFGIGCKVFTIAGPVILFGIFTSWLLGLIYWIGKILGFFS